MRRPTRPKRTGGCLVGPASERLHVVERFAKVGGAGGARRIPEAFEGRSKGCQRGVRDIVLWQETEVFAGRAREAPRQQLHVLEMDDSRPVGTVNRSPDVPLRSEEHTSE